MTSHTESVHAQFDPRASAYLASPVHAHGADLASAVELVRQQFAERPVILDAGCGAGHLAFALSPVAARVDALDASQNMLATVANTARQKNLLNIHTIHSAVETLPSGDAVYDVVATRYSAHHWRDLDMALVVMRRVLKPDGCLLVIDIMTWEDALIDTHLQTMEILRDCSHVRNRSDSEWRRHLDQHGFEVMRHEVHPVHIEFSSWIARMATPGQHADMIRTFQSHSPAEVRDAMQIESDGSFTMQTGLWFAHRKSG